MNILGITYGHDSSACVVKDGKILSAISSERILRKKKHDVVTNELINYVLEASGITAEEIDIVAISNFFVPDPYKNNKDYPLEILDDKNNPVFGFNFGPIPNDCQEFNGKLFGRDIKIVAISHHICHASAAYYTSNYENSWCFSLDSSGGAINNNSLIAKGIGNKLFSVVCPNTMIGHGYAQFTSYLGIGDPLYKAGSTMGLAAYGVPEERVIRNIDLLKQGSYFKNKNTAEEERADYVAYYYAMFVDLSGYYGAFEKKDSYSPNAIKMAANIQYIFEQCILDVVNKIDNDDINNLCLSGGSFLNCNANTLIKNNSRFKNIHHFPACGDDGLSVGAALYVAHNIFNEKRYIYNSKDIAYLGKKYEYVEPDYKKIAEAIASGAIVAWCMGPSEFGPRALGNRSILADPRNPHNRELLNFLVKKREWYRPFAPSVLEEECDKWFDFKGSSPYMLYTAKVLQPEKVPAITHIDGTARMQTVNIETNETYYKLIKEFHKITGVPMLLNTSLNGKDEPIVETEEDVYKFFKTTPVDAMVYNGVVTWK